MEKKATFYSQINSFVNSGVSPTVHHFTNSITPHRKRVEEKSSIALNIIWGVKNFSITWVNFPEVFVLKQDKTKIMKQNTGVNLIILIY